MTAADAPAKRRTWVVLPALLVALLAAALSPALTGRGVAVAPAALVAPPAPEQLCACWAAGSAATAGAELDRPAADLTGPVRDCCCDYETVDRLNEELLHPLLTRLVKQPFFRYFRVNLYCDCPFWPDDSMCALPDCSVCECPWDEVPLPWRTSDGAAEGAPAAPIPAEGADCGADGGGTTAEELVNAHEGAVNRTLDVGAEFRRAWRELDNPWTADDEAGADATYVNLVLNPERYTGYSGEHAHRVWAAIYSQPCFDGLVGGQCSAAAAAQPDARMFYRLISGLHTSITVHIVGDYLLDRARGVWGPNSALWAARLDGHVDWQENLYFTTLFVLRALLKAGDFLLAADYRTGSPGEDAVTAAQVRELVESPALRAACPVPFDESCMWKGADFVRRRDELQAHFRNISAVMDCVGCEKCRLWGKLQTLGLGTALKILFSLDSGSECPELQRNEVIALVNLLHRLSESVKLNREFRMGAHASAPLEEPADAHTRGLPSFL